MHLGDAHDMCVLFFVDKDTCIGYHSLLSTEKKKKKTRKKEEEESSSLPSTPPLTHLVKVKPHLAILEPDYFFELLRKTLGSYFGDFKHTGEFGSGDEGKFCRWH